MVSELPACALSLMMLSPTAFAMHACVPLRSASMEGMRVWVTVRADGTLAHARACAL